MKRIAFLLFLIVASQAYGAFGFYRTVTVDHTKVPSTQTNFPILVNFTNASLKTIGNGGKVQNANGYDIRPYTDSALTTAITGYELERYNATTGEVVMWVKLASLSSSVDTIIYLAYGDATISTDGSSATTWDANYKAIYHLKDGTTLSGTDSTTGNNGTINNTPAATTGQIDGAMHCVGVDVDGLYPLANPADFPVATAFTVSGWFKPVSAAINYIGVMWGEFANNGPHLQTDGAGTWGIRIWGGTNCDGGTTTAGAWQYVVGTYDGTNLRCYVNGSLTGGPTAATPTTSSSPTAAIGFTLVGSNPFDGDIDEVRISNSARSTDWVTTDYNSQNSPGTFFTLGSETPVGGASGNNKFFLLFP
jgi:hypothetical protein